jgi:hypothetical protein
MDRFRLAVVLLHRVEVVPLSVGVVVVVVVGVLRRAKPHKP